MNRCTGWLAASLIAFGAAACGGDGGGGAGAKGGSGGGAGQAGGAGSGGSGGAGGSAGTGGRAGTGGGAGTGGSAANRVGTSGGTVSDANGDITLEIPAGALAGDTQFTFTPEADLGGLPTGFVFTSGSAHRIDWTAAGFAGGVRFKLRLRVPVALADTDPDGELLASPFPIIMVQCQDGTWVEYGAILVNAGTLEQDVAPACLDSAGPGSTRVGAVTATGPLLPAITQQPTSTTVAAGDAAAFSVTATGAAPLAYQWRRNGTNITGASAASYGVSAAESSDNGAVFSVVVSNRYGSVTSADATLTVGPPRVPTWMPSVPLGAFATGTDLPQTGSLAGLDFVVWNDNGMLRAKTDGGAYAPIDTLAEAARSRPRVLTGANLLLGFIVFIDDSGASSCAGTTGDRLSAVGVRIGPEGQVFARSNRFTLYQSTGGCVAQFSAGLIDTDAAARPIAFALTELDTGQLKVGSGGAVGDAAGVWTYSAAALATLTFDASCGGAAFLTEDSLEGRRQNIYSAPVPVTTAVLTWIANEKLCAATLDGGNWTPGATVFDNAIGDPAIGPPEPAAAIDTAGNALVVASRVVNPAVMPYAQEMTAAFRAAAGGAWMKQALDTSDGIALPSAVFTPAGSALVVWRPSVSAGATTVYAATRSAGTWQLAQRISSSTAADTRFPRICVDGVGNALAVFQEKATASDPFKVWARLWRGGAWSAPGSVQDSTNEGRFAACVRHEAESFLRVGGAFVAWRETDPTDATRYRIVTAR